MLTVTHEAAMNMAETIIDFHMLTSARLRTVHFQSFELRYSIHIFSLFYLRLGRLNLLHPSQELAKADLLCVADHVDCRRNDRAYDQVFVAIAVFNAAECKLVVSERRFETEPAVAEAIEETRDPAIKS